MKIARYVIHTLFLLGLWLGLGLQAHAQTDTVYLYYTDPRGTPLVETDAQGNVIARYDYTPYGNPVASLGNPPNGPGYTGHVNDPETGLVYMQARYYQPTGRFLSPDPAMPTPGNVFDFNRYAYANYNPIMNIDPTGKYNCDIKHNGADCKIIKDSLRRIRNAARSYAKKSPQARALNRILKFYGTENDGNAVSIAFRQIDGISNGQTHFDENAGILVTFDTNAMNRNFGWLGSNAKNVEYAATTAHEGQHGIDAMTISGDPVGFSQRYQTEYNAFMSQSYLNQAFHTNSVYDVWRTNWPNNFANGYRSWEVDLQAQCATASSLCVAR